MPTVDLLFFPECPNVGVARDQLRRAFAAVGLPPAWNEHDISAADAPKDLRVCGSPTILVNGRDVTGDTPTGGAACRIYAASGERGAPPLDAIAAALRAESVASPPTRLASSVATLPGILMAALPVVGCASCWPAYAGVLSALGVPFLLDMRWLLPLTLGGLALAVAGLAFRARRRRGLGPLVVGLVAAAAIVVGKFLLAVDVVFYAGVALLITASVWNGWPKTHALSCAVGICGKGVAGRGETEADRLVKESGHAQEV